MIKTIEFLNNRFACKKYKEKEIEEEELRTILEAGRLAPSSFGLEPWTFHIARSKDILKECCYQESMKSAPITVVLTAKKGRFYAPDAEFLKERASRFPGSIDEFIADFEGYYDYLKSENRLDLWSKSQCYIAAAYMMIAASELGIESCAIEGYDNDALLEALSVNKNDEIVGIVVALGYSDEPAREKIRESLESIVVDHR